MTTEEKRQMQIVTGGDDPSEQLPPLVKTKDEAINYLQQTLAQLETRRAECNVKIPHDRELERKVQLKAYHKYLVNLGRCLEAPGIFLSVGLLDANGYREFYSRAMSTMMASVTGRV